VLGEKRELDEVLAMMGMTVRLDKRRRKEQREYPRLRLLEALDTLADEFGLRPIRGARRPRRERDAWDEVAPFAENPRLVEAMRLAKSVKVS
jgi:hypothetical protein